MAKEGHKARRVKLVTRAKALKLLKAGADPQQFEKHPNVHVRQAAWKKMGRPLPENADERAKFLADLHFKEKTLQLEVVETASEPLAVEEVSPLS
jgi:hypothetical protein